MTLPPPPHNVSPMDTTNTSTTVDTMNVMVIDPRVNQTFRSWHTNFHGSWGDDLVNLIDLCAELVKFDFTVNGDTFQSRFLFIPEGDQPPAIDVVCKITGPNGQNVGQFVAQLQLVTNGFGDVTLIGVTDFDGPDDIRNEFAVQFLAAASRILPETAGAR